ncbi:ectomycorrhiza-regulated small secreted protein [Laccaria bicolor S238N-H82]|uniref:Ectomycorrhiza-regulated small secreted protein n=1 Tax=Laccaria bicolor (strain S238N-H82 / ATCC MYA-4686) TaxID=486041 RepID=B0D743_LACBS|nr:ectomycorrhiza-regulated small secreted protein [Laccaria bicolor S238N-H82]EDR09585.1 ectomycorrhiza-regulated small secreted protein [Laccaria bicolor S238N-H82]|eukprot:XP_001879934.1 ectomycorrhiza-regulated small secreted protein [Laccaria bicolor S238N-H82]
MRCTCLMTIFMLALGAFAQDGTSTGTDGSLTNLPVPTTSTTLPDATTATDVTSITTTSVPTISSTSTTPSTTTPANSATTTAPTSLVTSYARTPAPVTTFRAPPLPNGNAAFRLALSNHDTITQTSIGFGHGHM